MKIYLVSFTVNGETHSGYMAFHSNQTPRVTTEMASAHFHVKVPAGTKITVR